MPDLPAPMAFILLFVGGVVFVVMTVWLVCASRDADHYYTQACQNYEQALKYHVLAKAVAEHYSQSVTDPCWENDEELWAHLQDGVVRTRPDRYKNPCDMMAGCVAYVASRFKEPTHVAAG